MIITNALVEHYIPKEDSSNMIITNDFNSVNKSLNNSIENNVKLCQNNAERVSHAVQYMVNHAIEVFKRHEYFIPRALDYVTYEIRKFRTQTLYLEGIEVVAPLECEVVSCIKIETKDWKNIDIEIRPDVYRQITSFVKDEIPIVMSGKFCGNSAVLIPMTTTDDFAKMKIWQYILENLSNPPFCNARGADIHTTVYEIQNRIFQKDKKYILDECRDKEVFMLPVSKNGVKVLCKGKRLIKIPASYHFLHIGLTKKYSIVTKS